MRDYAHKPGWNGKRPNSSKNPRADIAPAWGWTVLGIVLGLGIATLVGMKLFPKLVGIDRGLAKTHELDQDDDVIAKSSKESTKPLAKTSAPPQPKFDFYTLLPNMEELDDPQPNLSENNKSLEKAVEKPIERVASASTTSPTPIISAQQAKTAQPKVDNPNKMDASPQHPLLPKEQVEPKTDSFILQAGVFHTKELAENLKAQLILQGFEAHIEPYQKEQASAAWYRVYLGPFEAISEAKLAQVALQQNSQLASLVIKNKA